ncbi:hypothetical protein DdX_21354 [Ditylenchus destructor]|uniref:Uncharacterized protein n=1 Tax=Ditylenchus destructor TaxID=166010 RepID=A0AAD4QVT0_9BILA|nr:hypothetical protein DdX_21354 [Ditylenchus destructor]
MSFYFTSQKERLGLKLVGFVAVMSAMFDKVLMGIEGFGWGYDDAPEDFTAAIRNLLDHRKTLEAFMVDAHSILAWKDLKGEEEKLHQLVNRLQIVMKGRVIEAIKLVPGGYRRPRPIEETLAELNIEHNYVKWHKLITKTFNSLSVTYDCEV